MDAHLIEVTHSVRSESSVVVERGSEAEGVALQMRPVASERRRRAEQQHAGVRQSVLDLRSRAVARLDLPLIKPHPG